MNNKRTAFVQLTNGFGNNLFQYVATKNLAQFHKATVVAKPPHKEYYGTSCLEKLGVDFKMTNINNKVHHVNDSNYIRSFRKDLDDCDFVVNGYFEDYRYYYKMRNKIKTWFPKVDTRQDKDLVIHMRAGDRLFYKNEFYMKPQVDDYLRAIEQFEFDKVHVVTGMPKWDYVTEEELNNMKFHLNVPDNERVPIGESVEYFNSLVEGFAKYNPIVKSRTVGEDFDFIRSFKNILFEHGTLSWWAAFLSDADKVGVYGPWRAWKGKSNKNLSQIPLDTWFRWE